MKKEAMKVTNCYFYLFIFFIINPINAKHEKVKEVSENNASIELKWSQDELDQSSQKYFLYLKANNQRLSGNLSQAMVTFEKLFRLENVPEYAYEGFIKLIFELGNFKKVINLSNKIKTIFTDNLELHLMLAQSYLNMHQDSNAEKLFLSLVEKFPDNEQVAYYATVAYIKNNELSKALTFIDKCLKRPNFYSKYFLFHYLASKIYFHLDRKVKALEHIGKSLELFPDFEKGWLLKALLEEQLGNVNDAICGYKNFLNIVGRDLTVEKQLINLLFLSQKYDQAADVLRKMKLNNPEYFFDLALLEFKNKNYKQALENINKSLKMFPFNTKSRLLKVEILLADKQNTNALSFVKDWLFKNPYNSFVVHLLILLKRNGITQSAIVKTLEQVLEKHKNSQPILTALADLYLEENNYLRTIEACKNLTDIVKDDSLKSKLFFQIAYVNFIQNKKDSVENFLKQALQFKPAYPSAYNLLAYYYAKNNKNLDEALKLSDDALKSDSECYYYLDTKGFVLLKMGKLKEAIYILQKALSLVGDDKEIDSHLNLAKSLYKK